MSVSFFLSPYLNFLIPLFAYLLKNINVLLFAFFVENNSFAYSNLVLEKKIF